MISRPTSPIRLALLGSFAGLALAWGVIALTSHPTRPAAAPNAPLPAIISSRATAPAVTIHTTQATIPPAPDRFLPPVLAALERNNLKDLRAALAAWAAEDPAAALRWASNQAPPWRTEAIAAVLAAATDHGQFPAAASFAREAPSDFQADWTTLVFRRWGAVNPYDALATLADLPDSALRTTAFDALVSGWAATQPAGLAAYAAGLPAGPARVSALSAAIAAWSQQDPAAFSAWLSQFPPSPELDQAAAALVLRADTVNRTPEVALRWAETITDPSLRVKTIAHALREWSREDAAAAENYLSQTTLLTPEQRAQVRQSLAQP